MKLFFTDESHSLEYIIHNPTNEYFKVIYKRIFETYFRVLFKRISLYVKWFRSDYNNKYLDKINTLTRNSKQSHHGYIA